MLTRVVSGLWGGRRAGSFAGRAADHPVGELTRVVSGLWGGKRVGSFAGRVDVTTEEHPGVWNYPIFARRRNRR